MMAQDEQHFDELQTIMTDALLQMQRLISSGTTQHKNFIEMACLFLISMISTTADLAEVNFPGAAPYIYADIEAAAKQGGIRAIKRLQLEGGGRSYSVSGIAPDDETTAMNYLGNELGTALFKHIHELPERLRTPEMLLRGVEALLANLLHQKFNASHHILDSLCEHVHMALNDLKSRTQVCENVH